MAKFPRGHAATKKLIASCAANGVGIEGLEDAPRFRFIPAHELRGESASRDSFDNGKAYGCPSPRGTVSVSSKPKPKGIRTWSPARSSLDPQYTIAMAGDDAALTNAREAYAGGDPKPLRAYLAAEAAKRRASNVVRLPIREAIQLQLAA